MKKIFNKARLFVYVLLAAVVLSSFGSVAKASEPLTIKLFYSDTCSHCAAEEAFLKKTLPKYPNIVLESYEVSKNVELFEKFANKHNNPGYVPFLIVGDKAIVGLKESEILKSFGAEKKPSQKKTIKLPLFGEINAFDFSLPILAIVMGGVDGFNPCAMWVLLFLISLLLGFENRKKMWILGGTFIVASAFVYFLFMVAWLKLFTYLSYIAWIKIGIGVLALTAGVLNIKKGLASSDGGCEITGSEKRQETFKKLRKIINSKSFILALGGIILLAFAVNLVELACSLGFPATFVQVLTMSKLASWQYYSYILLYIFFFMLDDIVVFVIAMVTLKMTGLSTKYSKWSSLFGGAAMVVIGILLIFKPEWLSLG